MEQEKSILEIEIKSTNQQTFLNFHSYPQEVTHIIFRFTHKFYKNIIIKKLLALAPEQFIDDKETHGKQQCLTVSVYQSANLAKSGINIENFFGLFLKLKTLFELNFEVLPSPLLKVNQIKLSKFMSKTQNITLYFQKQFFCIKYKSLSDQEYKQVPITEKILDRENFLGQNFFKTPQIFKHHIKNTPRMSIDIIWPDSLEIYQREFYQNTPKNNFLLKTFSDMLTNFSAQLESINITVTYFSFLFNDYVVFDNSLILKIMSALEQVSQFKIQLNLTVIFLTSEGNGNNNYMASIIKLCYEIQQLNNLSLVFGSNENFICQSLRFQKELILSQFKNITNKIIIKNYINKPKYEQSLYLKGKFVFQKKHPECFSINITTSIKYQPLLSQTIRFTLQDIPLNDLQALWTQFLIPSIDSEEFELARFLELKFQKRHAFKQFKIHLNLTELEHRESQLDQLVQMLLKANFQNAAIVIVSIETGYKGVQRNFHSYDSISFIALQLINQVYPENIQEVKFQITHNFQYGGYSFPQFFSKYAAFQYMLNPKNAAPTLVTDIYYLKEISEKKFYQKAQFIEIRKEYEDNQIFALSQSLKCFYYLKSMRFVYTLQKSNCNVKQDFYCDIQFFPQRVVSFPILNRAFFEYNQFYTYIKSQKNFEQIQFKLFHKQIEDYQYEDFFENFELISLNLFPHTEGSFKYIDFLAKIFQNKSLSLCINYQLPIQNAMDNEIENLKQIVSLKQIKNLRIQISSDADINVFFSICHHLVLNLSYSCKLILKGNESMGTLSTIELKQFSQMQLRQNISLTLAKQLQQAIFPFQYRKEIIFQTLQFLVRL